MSLTFEIAKRYLFAKKSQNVINIISGISGLGVMVATAALIIILSVFNGLNGMVRSLFGAFDPDLRVVQSDGKPLEADSAMRSKLLSVPGVADCSAVLQDNALVRYGKRQVTATVMGVEANYGAVTGIDSIIIDGSLEPNACVMGIELTDKLGVSSAVYMPTVTFYAPKRVGKINMQNPEASFVEKSERVGGTFLVQQSSYDSQYILTSIGTARSLFCYDGAEASAIDVRVAAGHDVQDVAERLSEMLGDKYDVKDKWRQHENFFRMMEVEKFMAFFILLFIVLIASFNVIGSLSMLIFEKQESISVLRSMGATQKMVTQIFLFEGWLVSVGGALLGMLLGVALVLIQERWGVVTLGNSEDYIISAYPVTLEATDVALTFMAVVALAAVAAWYPVKSIVGKYYNAAR